MYAFAQDLRFALRQLRRVPGFTLTVILTLALGIGITTAIFSLVESILLRPLPFNRAERLVLLGDHLGNGAARPVTAREISTYANATSAFSSMGGFITATYELSGGETPETVDAARFGASVFSTLGVQPVLGRVFTQHEDDAHQPVAVISYALWTNRFHSDPHVLGNSIVLDRKPYSIIGVMPRDFEFPLETGRLDQAQLWVPLSLGADELSQNGFWGYQIVARLKHGVTVQQGALDADRVAQEVMRGFPPQMAAIHIRGDVTPLHEYAVAEARPLLRTLLLASFVVLLIACVNVAGLLLVQAIRRRRESAVRLALGARSSAILRASVLEGLLLSFVGGLLGLLLAAIAVRIAVQRLPESMPRVDSISVDGTVAAFALLLALVTGIFCSLAPAFAAVHTNMMDSLKSSRSGADGAGHGWLRSGLVVAEIAIALVLLTASGAFLRSFQKMRAVDPGFRPDHVVVAGYSLPIDQYATQSSADIFDQAVVDRLAAKPGVLAVGITNILPATGGSAAATYTREGEPVSKWKLQFANFSLTYGDYFQALQIPLIDGRYFTLHDRTDAPLVVIVNQSMANHAWPGQRAVGQRMHVGNPHKGLPWATVVGVVANTKLGARDEPDADQWYAPVQQPEILYGHDPSGRLNRPADGFIAIRSALPPEQMTKTLRSVVAEIDPLLALQQVQSMNEVVSNIEAPRRFNTELITLFGAAALLLALIGIYAVVAFSASLRTQEIAIRVALGAQRTGIARLVLVSGIKLALIGCALGVVASLAVSRVVSSFLFDVSATDPLIYLASVTIMIVIAVLAALQPAARAAASDPIDALRSI
jgi:putative ABC transport system permease protein